MSEIAGWIVLGLAGLIGTTNFYLSFLRYLVHRAFGWKYHFVSGCPVVGTILLVIALALLWGTPIAWVVAGVIAVVDTGGLPWFAMVMAWVKIHGEPVQTDK